MALEDIVKGFERFDQVSQVEATLVQDPHSPQARDGFGKYMNKYQGISEADSQLMATTLELDTMRRQLVNLRGEAHTNLADIAKANYEAVLDNLPEDRLLDYAMHLGKVKITRSMLAQAQKDEDYEGVRGILFSKYTTEKDGKKKTNHYWEEFIDSIKDPRALLQLGMVYADEERNKFIAKSVGRKEKGEKGKDKYVIEKDKLRNYITDKLKGLKKDEEREAEYVQLAGIYRQYKASKK